MAAVAGGGEAVQKALQSVAQGTGWTYSVLWCLCPHQGALVWAEGHYNGAIKTRKTTVTPGGEEEEEEEEEEEATEAGAGRAARRRSRQLRELYDSLAREATADGGGSRDAALQVVVSRRPSAALAPEDLTETEWFYLMCASYCFPPAVGLPGEAFARRGHVWLCGANKVDSKVFSRAILARTVACIPVNNDDGVLEIGTTEKVEEDIGLIQYARSVFMDQHGIPIMPTLSGHSTSNPSTHINQHPSQIKMEKHIHGTNVQPNNLNPEDEHIETEDDEDRIDSETNTENDSCRHLPLDHVGNEQARPNNAQNNDMMQIETSESLRDDCTNHVDEEIPMLMVCQNGNLPAQDELGSWNFLYEDLISSKYQQSSDIVNFISSKHKFFFTLYIHLFFIPAVPQDQAVLAENAHYIETVLTILRHNAHRQAQTAASSIKTYLALSKNSSFSRWNPKVGTNDIDLQRMLSSEGAPQRMLKSILFSAPSSSHRRHRGEAAQSPEPSRDDGEGTGGSRGGQALAELSASHVVKERQRREKLNERFIVLRSLVPFVTKMDKASILGDTIEYVKQLRRRIQDLESRARLQIDGHQTTTRALAVSKEKRARSTSTAAMEAETGRKVRAVEASSSCSTSGGAGKPPAASTEVQVSIIESDALLELRCPHRDGLLLRVMQALHRELGLEVTSVQASSAGDVLLVELRAKVKEVHGRRSSINEVKRSIHLIISSD
ncbi:Basic helix-loop-helix protein A [Dichanthelium oligosanthes]|uniref:Basic helix-loop-helix protein A n=1 Tax=Dichanthelium oligosanthes TaxID=888268 RepID=A0A1E5VN50_9POAL|nr:Basic helix-loop-helix protein A [Dichanthelium oligosanthes]